MKACRMLVRGLLLLALPQQAEAAPRIRVGADGVARLTVYCSEDTGEGEFPTIHAARDALRLHRGSAAAAAAAPAPAVVDVRGRCGGGIDLGALDAGTSWVGARHGGERAVISGGLPLPGGSGSFTPVRDPAVLKHLPASARGSVRQLNLTAMGLTPADIGKLGPHWYPGGNAQIDFYKFLPVGAAELFVGGRPLHRARWPNCDDDQLLIPQNSMKIEHVDRAAGGLEANRIELPGSGGSPAVTALRLANWAAEVADGRALWAHGEWSGNGWSDTHKPVIGEWAFPVDTPSIQAIYP
jgi:hypothetical protein